MQTFHEIIKTYQFEYEYDLIVLYQQYISRRHLKFNFKYYNKWNKIMKKETEVQKTGVKFWTISEAKFKSSAGGNATARYMYDLHARSCKNSTDRMCVLGFAGNFFAC